MRGLRRGRIVAVVATAAVAFLGLCPGARALGEVDSGGFGEFKIEGSNGYTITVWAFSERKFRHGQVLVLVGRKGRFVSYLAPARVTDTRIDANLGSLGDIDVTFQPSGRTGFVHPTCEPRNRTRYEKGNYVGRIEFLGEEGYTRASAERVPFTYHPAIDLGCFYSVTDAEFGPDLPGAQLSALARKGGQLVGVLVNQNRPGAPVRVTAAIVEQRGPVSIHREVDTTYGAQSFDFAPDLSSAAFDPPAPFSGSGLYRRGAKPANRWTGDLAVDFPGHSNVPLTGARFRAKLRHARFVHRTFSGA